jgi:nicotinamide phosphoribosyltransferase
LLKIHRHFEINFFGRTLSDVLEDFREGYSAHFGEEPKVDHVIDLYNLGYLPLMVKSLPEGSICPIGVPMLTIYNTKPEFYWLPNSLETIMSTELWLPMTSATISREYAKIGRKWSEITCDNDDHLDFQFHDFSMRGMAGLEAAMASGAGHLLFSKGTDTIPAVDYFVDYYDANKKTDFIGVSIPATEHSVMSMGTKDDELGTFRRLVTQIYPKGLISIVSDTWDLWKVCTEYLPELKDEIMARDGKVVIRPDSGDPVDIICGTEEDPEFYTQTSIGFGIIPEEVGVIGLLWNTFGGTVNSKGYKVLDPHIGAIYGDSITLDRAKEILERLEAKGFAASNIVFGVGSFTYQYNTRDTYGFAMKATYGEVNGEGRPIFKDPVTDDGTKKSLKGLLSVYEDLNGKIKVLDDCTWEKESQSLFVVKYVNGEFVNTDSLNDIRSRCRI